MQTISDWFTTGARSTWIDYYKDLCKKFVQTHPEVDATWRVSGIQARAAAKIGNSAGTKVRSGILQLSLCVLSLFAAQVSFRAADI